MKFVFDSEEQKSMVISKVKNVAPEIARDLYLNALQEGFIGDQPPKTEDSNITSDENIQQIKL